ncbi:DUF6328 family protein [Massilia eburnea]|nr:DUF6328 family protein [Massilia eburnea]
MDEHAEKESLKEQMTRINEEARMILPGIQALFGFQSIAVFSERFDQLPAYAQDCHAVALALVVLAIGLVMLPAAYHRLVEAGRISGRTITIASRAICYALVPLAAGLALDISVVLYMVTEQNVVSAAGGIAAFVLLVGMWFAYPLHARR